MEKRRKPGRPPKAPGEKLERLVLYVSRETGIKVAAAGQEWARAVLKRAKPPAG